MAVQTRLELPKASREIHTVVGRRILHEVEQFRTARLKHKDGFVAFRAVIDAGELALLRTSASVICLVAPASTEPKAAEQARLWSWSEFRRLPRFTTQVSALRQEVLALRQGALRVLLIPLVIERFGVAAATAEPGANNLPVTGMERLVVELKHENDRLAELVATLKERDSAAAAWVGLRPPHSGR